MQQVLRQMFKLKAILHPDFEQLNDFIRSLPEVFNREGTVLYKGRNELRQYRIAGYDLVVKSFKRPHLINRIVYGFLRPSKAERSYQYALKLLKTGFKTPQPVGFVTCRKGICFEKSYYISLKSTCSFTYKDFNHRSFQRQDEILKAIALFTARLHESGFLHKDYSAGNILFDDTTEKIPIEIIDLNRIVFRKVNMEDGCKNFERLPGSDDMLTLMGTIYAKSRGFDPETCVSKIKKYVQTELDARQKRC